MIFFEQLIVNSRLAVKALGKAERNQFYQVLIAGIILTKKNKMVILAIEFKGFIEAGTRRDIDLTSDNRLDALLFTFPIKIDHTVHHAVIGYRKGVLTKLLGTFDKERDTTGAVQQTELGMQMQVCE